MSRRRFTFRALPAALVVLALLVAAIAAVSDSSVRRAISPLHRSSARAGASASCVPARLNVSAALAGSRVTVSPGPQTRDASATTQISLLGVPAGELSNVVVKGSRTGTHPGRLEAYSQGDGASFLPSRPFAAGETVSVHAEVTADGHATPFAWSFVVAMRDVPGAAKTASKSKPAAAPKNYQRFHTLPSVRPPIVTVASKASTATDKVFLAPYSGVGQYGPMILDEHGGLLWFQPIPAGARAANLRVQQYEGKPVLTWWQGPLVANGNRQAGVVIADSSYKTLAIVRAGNGYQPDLHEFEITPRGTGLITIYTAIDCDVSSVGGPRDGAVADTLLQEIDLKTGLVKYEWHSLDHVSLASSYASAKPTSRAQPFDYFHINSIDVQQNGDLLVDARNTWAAYDIDAKTGKVRWQVGGKHSSFKMGPGTRIAYQHDARQQPNGAITFFDNGAFPQVHRQSRAIEVRLDMARMTDTLVRSRVHRNPLVAGSQGNLQALPNGDRTVGWGQAGYLSEIDAAGRVLFNAHLPSSWESYRTYVQPWSGQPATAPALTISPSAGNGAGAVAYVSWNGATEVASWRVLAGLSPSSLAPVATAPRTGFETAIPLKGAAAPYVEAQALDGSGAVIGVSTAVKG
ncbi:MAG TPA: arylsulfotransferase family protein [Solirubrobacteraceae bacterium]|nr:arylsulfotransferase family protein [Solirubrobacteraceae bacterium]